MDINKLPDDCDRSSVITIGGILQDTLDQERWKFDSRMESLRYCAKQLRRKDLADFVLRICNFFGGGNDAAEPATALELYGQALSELFPCCTPTVDDMALEGRHSSWLIEACDKCYCTYFDVHAASKMLGIGFSDAILDWCADESKISVLKLLALESRICLSSPGDAKRLCEKAVQAARSLCGGLRPVTATTLPVATQLLLFCEARLGNWFRARGRTKEAWRFLSRPLEFARQGKLNALISGHVLAMGGSYQQRIGNAESGRRLVQRAIKTFRAAGARHDASIASLVLADVMRDLDADPAACLESAQHADCRLDRRRSPGAATALDFSMVVFLLESGQIASAKNRHQKLPSSAAELKLKKELQEGLILRCQGEAGKAATALERTADNYIAAGVNDSAASACLYAAEAHANAGDWIKAEQRLIDAAALFGNCDLKESALAAAKGALDIRMTQIHELIRQSGGLRPTCFSRKD